MNPQIEFLPWLSSLFLSSSLFLGLMAVINLLIRKQSVSHRHSLQLSHRLRTPPSRSVLFYFSIPQLVLDLRVPSSLSNANHLLRNHYRNAGNFFKDRNEYSSHST